MHWDDEFLWRAALALTAIALLWSAIGFGAYALCALLVPLVGAAGAAALTAAALLTVLVVGFWLDRRMPRKVPAQREAIPALRTGQPADAAANALVQLAKDHPLLAVGCATLLGVAQTIQSDSTRQH